MFWSSYSDNPKNIFNSKEEGYYPFSNIEFPGIFYIKSGNALQHDKYNA